MMDIQSQNIQRNEPVKADFDRLSTNLSSILLTQSKNIVDSVKHEPIHQQIRTITRGLGLSHSHIDNLARAISISDD